MRVINNIVYDFYRLVIFHTSSMTVSTLPEIVRLVSIVIGVVMTVMRMVCAMVMMVFTPIMRVTFHSQILDNLHV